MYLDCSKIKVNGKVYTRYLLRESYREGKKVKNRTIANLSRCSPEEIEAIRLALQHKKDLDGLKLRQDKDISIKQGLSVGAVWVLYVMARQLGIADALGHTRQGKLALWQVMARIIDQGSRLSAVRLAGTHAVWDVLGLGKFNEDNLYDNLDWLCENQSKIQTAIKKIQAKSERLKLSGWAIVNTENNNIVFSINEELLKEESKLDGCYVLKSDLSKEAVTKETIHSRYKDLSLVESAFRVSKTDNLEVRPIHVRLGSRTRGHVFVVMMAYRIIQELAERWEKLDMTVAEGIGELSSLCANEVSFNGKEKCNQIPEPRDSVKKLLEAANIQLPDVLPYRGVKVTTKKKLTSRRIP